MQWIISHREGSWDSLMIHQEQLSQSLCCLLRCTNWLFLSTYHPMNPKNYTAKCLHKLGCLKSQTKTVIRFQIIIQIGMFLPWLVSQMLKIDKLVCSYAKSMFESFQSKTQEVKRIDSHDFLRVFSSCVPGYINGIKIKHLLSRHCEKQHQRKSSILK